jgi:hypothetical protein
MLLEGRKQPRTPERFVVQIHAGCDPGRTELATTEDVSSGGTRLITESVWKPRSHVVLKSPPGNVWAIARVVYCQAASPKGFAVGLNFLSKPSNVQTRDHPVPRTGNGKGYSNQAPRVGWEA